MWVADWFNEIVNALVLQASDRAPLWAATGPTAYQFLVGLNVEISFMFALAGIVYAKLLPPDRSTRILGMPNRLAIALGLSSSASPSSCSCTPRARSTGSTGGGTRRSCR